MVFRKTNSEHFFTVSESIISSALGQSISNVFTSILKRIKNKQKFITIKDIEFIVPQIAKINNSLSTNEKRINGEKFNLLR